MRLKLGTIFTKRRKKGRLTWLLHVLWVSREHGFDCIAQYSILKNIQRRLDGLKVEVTKKFRSCFAARRLKLDDDRRGDALIKIRSQPRLSSIINVSIIPPGAGTKEHGQKKTTARRWWPGHC